MDGRAQGQSVGATVDSCRAVLPPSLEAMNSEQKQMPPCDMGEEVNSDAVTAWLPKKVGQSARHIDINHQNNVKNNVRRDVSYIA